MLSDEELAKTRSYLERAHEAVGGIEQITPRAVLSAAEIGAIRTVYFAEQLLGEVDALRERLTAAERSRNLLADENERLVDANKTVEQRERAARAIIQELALGLVLHDPWQDVIAVKRPGALVFEAKRWLAVLDGLSAPDKADRAEQRATEQEAGES